MNKHNLTHLSINPTILHHRRSETQSLAGHQPPPQEEARQWNGGGA